MSHNTGLANNYTYDRNLSPDLCGYIYCIRKYDYMLNKFIYKIGKTRRDLKDLGKLDGTDNFMSKLILYGVATNTDFTKKNIVKSLKEDLNILYYCINLQLNCIIKEPSYFYCDDEHYLLAKIKDLIDYNNN